MDIHRCRFSEWMPSAACAMSFHPELPLLAVGRENGDIELWNTEEKWFCECVTRFICTFICRELQVMRTCLFVLFFGLAASIITIFHCFVIGCLEPVSRVNCLR